MIRIVLLLLLASRAFAAPADQITPKVLPMPAPTAWKPEGCRSVPFLHPVELERTAFHRAHGDLESTNEVDLAYPPTFARQWAAEPNLFQVTTPSFDGAGNVYMTPLFPHEPVLLVSLDATTGARRFSVPLGPGERGGGAAPVVLRDPDSGDEVVYVNRYDHVLAIRTDGSVFWDMPTGLPPVTASDQSGIGLAWVPNADAIVGLTRDGYVFLLDRRTGAQLMTAPYRLPGEKTPSVPSTAPPALAAQVDALLAPLVAFPSGGVVDLIQVLLGGNSKVANNLSVDPRTNRLWIASSARDGEDGTVDGVSELGAIYRYDVVRDGAAWTLAEVCHRNFEGGSASTPTLARNGTRVYLGDNVGALIAIDAETCTQAWAEPLDSQIFGSIAAASDNDEVYAASAGGIFQVFDEGDRGRRGWTAALDLYDVPASLPGYIGLNVLLTGIGANGLFVQTGVGIRPGAQTLPVRTGIAHLDRLTGQARWFADGLEESLAAMSTGPDGALYLSHSPLRRAFSLALGLTTQPLVGGMSKWGATRFDLLARDAACAAADRGANASTERTTCPDSAAADLVQVGHLRSQMIDAVGRAQTAGTLDAGIARRVQKLDKRLRREPQRTTPATISRLHKKTARTLGRVCRLLTSGKER
jgi:outer membrane protein assembly factor BamB